MDIPVQTTKSIKIVQQPEPEPTALQKLFATAGKLMTIIRLNN